MQHAMNGWGFMSEQLYLVDACLQVKVHKQAEMAVILVTHMSICYATRVACSCLLNFTANGVGLELFIILKQ